MDNPYLGLTCISTSHNVETIGGPPDIKLMMHMIDNQRNDPEDMHFINSTFVFSMRPVLKRVAGFLGVSCDFTGLMGKPAEVSKELFSVLSYLQYTLEEETVHFFVCPYHPEYLHKWAFADYLFVAREWVDGPGEPLFAKGTGKGSEKNKKERRKKERKKSG